MPLNNVMEYVVRTALKDLSQRDSRLQHSSEQAINDILAITLNQLPPKYVVTTKGEMYAKTQISKQMETDVYRELSQAIDKVMHSTRDPAFKEDDENA